MSALVSDEDDSSFIEVSFSVTDAKDDHLFPASVFQAIHESSEDATTNPSDAQSQSASSQPDPVRTERDTVEQTSALESPSPSAAHRRTEAAAVREKWLKDLSSRYKVQELLSAATVNVSLYKHNLNILFQELNANDVSDVMTSLDTESSSLRSERGKQERLATGITEQINAEAQVLVFRSLAVQLASCYCHFAANLFGFRRNYCDSLEFRLWWRQVRRKRSAHFSSRPIRRKERLPTTATSGCSAQKLCTRTSSIDRRMWKFFE